MRIILLVSPLTVTVLAEAQVSDWQAGMKMDNMIFSSYILAHAGADDNDDDTMTVDGEPLYIINKDGTSQIFVVLDLDSRADVKIELLASETNTYLTGIRAAKPTLSVRWRPVCGKHLPMPERIT